MRSEVEDALRAAEGQAFRRLVEDAPVGIFHTSLDGRLLYANAAAARMFRYQSPAQMTSEVVDVARQLFAAPERREALVAQALSSRDFVLVENQYRRPDGSGFATRLHLRAARDERGSPVYLEGFVEDVTDRKRLDDELRRSEVRYRTLFEMEADAIVVLDEATGRIVEVNRAATELYGYTREEFVRLRNVDVSAEPEQTRHCTLERVRWVPQRWHHRKDGSTFLCEIWSRALELEGQALQMVTIRDITERSHAEEMRTRLLEQLQRSQKMETLGRLAGGIAHDFNNLLTIVRGCARLVQEHVGPDARVQLEIEEICDAADQGAMLTRQLLAFARQEVLPRGRADASRVLQAMCALLVRVLGARIAVKANIPDGLGAVPVSEVQLQQVVLNLAINARDAMPGGGTLEVRAERCLLSVGETGSAPAEYVAIAVQDTGTGMTEMVRAHLFEPFFTTKPVGVGTGLGLATSNAIVRDAGGTVTVASIVGAGSTFTIWLPILHEEP